jgi:hypothetical protein
MRAPDLRSAGVGVAGFEPTASSSRTAGKAVDRGCIRTSRAVGGHIETVPVDAVAVLRCCTTAASPSRTSSAWVAQTRHGTWFHAG